MCGGSQVRSSQGFFTVQQTCPQCGGAGEEITHRAQVVVDKVKNKQQKDYLLRFQKVLMMATRIRLSGKGEAGSRGAGSGDLYLFINVYSHELFKRSDENLFSNFQYQLPMRPWNLNEILQLMEVKQK